MNAKILIRNKSIFSTHDTEYRKKLDLGHEPAVLTAAEDLYEPVEKSVAKRLPWLIILLGLGLVVSSVVGIFENVVASLPIIIVFQSLVLDMAGNVGTQSLAVTIRVLMDETVSRRQKLQLIIKETRVGFLNGLILGSLSFLFIGLYLMLKRAGADFLLRGIFLYRCCPAHGDVPFKPVRNYHSAPFQKMPYRPGCRIRPSHHDRQRPVRSRDLLWNGMAFAHRSPRACMTAGSYRHFYHKNDVFQKTIDKMPHK